MGWGLSDAGGCASAHGGPQRADAFLRTPLVRLLVRLGGGHAGWPCSRCHPKGPLQPLACARTEGGGARQLCRATHTCARGSAPTACPCAPSAPVIGSFEGRGGRPSTAPVLTAPPPAPSNMSDALATATCQRCQARFAPAERIVSSSGTLFHEHCFVCAQCFRPFPDGLFYEVSPPARRPGPRLPGAWPARDRQAPPVRCEQGSPGGRHTEEGLLSIRLLWADARRPWGCKHPPLGRTVNRNYNVHQIAPSALLSRGLGVRWRA